MSDIPTLLLIAAGLPFVAFIISLLITEKYSWLTSIIAPLLMLGCCILSGIALASTTGDTNLLYTQKWFTMGGHEITANLSVSGLSCMMFFVVSVISFLIHFYSAGYMASDPAITRYYAMLGFFTFAMLGIVLADNLLLLFCFWELVGFASYMLIGHYMTKDDTGPAATKAFITNRIGDVVFITGLMIIWTQTQTFELSALTSASISKGWLTVATLCIFGGIAGKSAQFPLFTWLPDAMAGPTPVSALIHAATMVAAGVYLMIRIFPLFPDDALFIVTIIGAVTSLIAALSACVQFDIKKILAYSTISQLGLMFIALGMKAVDAAWLHLFSHAFFKACLFLCAGSVIHSLHDAAQQHHETLDPQDIRNMGGLRKKMPVTFLGFIISSAALSGIPFTSGFLSKDYILTLLWQSGNPLSKSIFIITCLISLLTAVYSFRMIWYLLAPGPSGSRENVESPIIMRIPIVILALCSLWFVVSINPFDYSGWIVTTDNHSILVMITSIVLILAGIAVAYFLFGSREKSGAKIFKEGFLIDQFTTRLVTGLSAKASGMTLSTDKKVLDRSIHLWAFGNVTLAHFISWADRNIIDGIVSVFITIVRFLGNIIRNTAGGKIQQYVFWSVFAIIIFIIWTSN
jgi:NADH-quinone oxidoreductase subunit L